MTPLLDRLTPTEMVVFNPRHAVARHLNFAFGFTRLAARRVGYDRLEAKEEAMLRLNMARMIRTQGIGKEWVI